MTLEEAREHTGDAVIYRPAHPALPSEEGTIITSVNHRFVFVRYGDDLTAKATPPEDLTLLAPTTTEEE